MIYKNEYFLINKCTNYAKNITYRFLSIFWKPCMTLGTLKKSSCGDEMIHILRCPLNWDLSVDKNSLSVSSTHKALSKDI